MPRIEGRYTKRLAEYAAGLGFDDIPPDVVAHAKRVVLNQIGATLSGWMCGPGLELLPVLEAQGGSGEATVFGKATRLPAPSAAAINATLAWAPMNDDTHVRSLFHTGHNTVPPALAEAEARGASGRDVLTAVVAANEVGIRIGLAVSPTHDPDFSSSRLGFWSEMKGPFAAAVATAKILGLDAEAMGHAIGIAASSTSGLQELGESSPASGTLYAWEAGKGVINGMLAARLAANGMTGGPEPLEGPLGWVRLYTWSHGRLEWLTEGLGSDYETARIQIKTRCNSSMVHTIIDAVDGLVRDHRLAPEAIDRIVVTGQMWLKQYLWRFDVRTYQDAIFSLPFSMALVILEPGPMTYPDQVVRRIGDPAIAGLMAKMELAVDSAIPLSAEMPGRIAIRTRDGRVLEAATADKARGAYPDRPLEPGEIEDKFRRLGREALGPDPLEGIIESVANLDRVGDIRSLATLLRPKATARRPAPAEAMAAGRQDR